jgi:hypothetical protein
MVSEAKATFRVPRRRYPWRRLEVLPAQPLDLVTIATQNGAWLAC